MTVEGRLGEIYNDDISALVSEGDPKEATQNWKGSNPFKPRLPQYFVLIKGEKVKVFPLKKFEKDKKEGLSAPRYLWIKVCNQYPPFLF